MKICNKCRKLKNLKDFHKNSRETDGLQNWCMECTREQNTNYKERRMELHRMKTYGVSKEAYAALLEESKNTCLLCGNHQKRLVIDHSHTTGEVRGILCVNCNLGLGSFKESIELLHKAIAYLQK